MPCHICNGRFDNSRPNETRCPQGCFDGGVVISSDFSECEGAMEIDGESCQDCIPVVTRRRGGQDLLRQGYELANCTTCQGQGIVMATCTANYHVAADDRVPRVCNHCGGTYSDPALVQYRCSHEELQSTRPCHRGMEGPPCIYSACSECGATGISGGIFGDCPGCEGTGMLSTPCNSAWHRDNDPYE